MKTDRKLFFFKVEIIKIVRRLNEKEYPSAMNSRLSRIYPILVIDETIYGYRFSNRRGKKRREIARRGCCWLELKIMKSSKKLERLKLTKACKLKILEINIKILKNIEN